LLESKLYPAKDTMERVESLFTRMNASGHQWTIQEYMGHAVAEEQRRQQEIRDELARQVLEEEEAHQ